jgi:hypothetical protein
MKKCQLEKTWYTIRVEIQDGFPDWLVKKWKLNTTWTDHQLLGHYFWHRCNSHRPVEMSDDYIRKKNA